MRRLLFTAVFGIGLVSAQAASAQTCQEARQSCIGISQNPCGGNGGWSCDNSMQHQFLVQAIQDTCRRADATCAEEDQRKANLLRERLDTFHRCINANLNNPRVCDSLNPG